MRILSGILVALAGLAAGAYVGIIVLMDGVQDAVGGFKANPTDVGRITWGIIQITPLTETAGGAVAVIGVLMGLAIVKGDESSRFPMTRRFRPRPGQPVVFRSSGRWPGF
ncbi:MAG TPA: hypothetical protein VFP35_00515 [Candidatus Saccharimonadales bacterium]|nr:hypothetical protein [Candidatus Saccharimonadales bacterium]